MSKDLAAPELTAQFPRADCVSTPDGDICNPCRTYSCAVCGEQTHITAECPHEERRNAWLEDRRDRCNACHRHGHQYADCLNETEKAAYQKYHRERCKGCGGSHLITQCPDPEALRTHNEWQNEYYHNTLKSARIATQLEIERQIDGGEIDAPQATQSTHHCTQCGGVGHNRASCASTKRAYKTPVRHAVHATSWATPLVTVPTTWHVLRTRRRPRPKRKQPRRGLRAADGQNSDSDDNAPAAKRHKPLPNSKGKGKAKQAAASDSQDDM